MIAEEKVEDVYKLVTIFCRKWNIYSEDRVQDLVWDVWQKLDRLYDEKKAKLSTYVYLCCKHIVLQERRKKSVNTVSINNMVADDIEFLDQFPSDCRSPLEELLYQEELSNIRKIYESCSDLLKDYLNGKTQQALAEEYNISQAHVSRRIKSELEEIRKKVIK